MVFHVIFFIDYYIKKMKLDNKCLSKIDDYERIVLKSKDQNIIPKVNKDLLSMFQKECL